MSTKLFSDKIYKKLPPILSEVTGMYEGRNRDVILLSSITVLSNSFPKIKAYYDDEIFYPQLYTMIVAPPASGKGIMMKAKKLIEPIHKSKKDDSLGLSFSTLVSDTEMMNTAREDKKKEKEKPVPPILTIVPANTSSTELIKFMNLNSNGVIMIESEMDTMGNVLKNEWGNYSDLLRKAFQHESISESRQIDNKFVSIDQPKLAVLLSGTPDQIKGISSSQENGLLSRFLIYSYEDISKFKNVFSREPDKKNKVFSQQGLKVLKIYKSLDLLKDEVTFSLTESQEKFFVKFFQEHQNSVILNEPLDFISNLRRLALMVFRVCIVLTVCRLGEAVAKSSTIKCSNGDFIIALRLVEDLIDHSLFSFKSFPNNGISELDMELIDSFEAGEVFSRTDFIDAGMSLGFAERTLANKLNAWKRSKIIKQIKHGIYRKK